LPMNTGALFLGTYWVMGTCFMCDYESYSYVSVGRALGDVVARGEVVFYASRQLLDNMTLSFELMTLFFFFNPASLTVKICSSKQQGSS
jgi:hypothetical protein